MNWYLHQPREISIETFTLCNAQCTFCPYPTLERKGEKMSDATIQFLLAQMSEWKYPFFFSPFKVNEPLLDNRLQTICEQVRDNIPRAQLRLFTNGSTLTPKNLTWIAKLNNVEHLWVSLNTFDPVTHHKVMGLNLNNTLSKLDELHARIKTGEFPHKVTCSAVSVSHVADAIFAKTCSKLFPLFSPRIVKRDAWLGYTEAHDKEVPASPCTRWWELSITSQGIASLCCMDGKGEFAVGNANEKTLLEIYNQPTLLNRRLGTIARRSVEPCMRCTY